MQNNWRLPPWQVSRPNLTMLEMTSFHQKQCLARIWPASISVITSSLSIEATQEVKDSSEALKTDGTDCYVHDQDKNNNFSQFSDNPGCYQPKHKDGQQRYYAFIVVRVTFLRTSWCVLNVIRPWWWSGWWYSGKRGWHHLCHGQEVESQ